MTPAGNGEEGKTPAPWQSPYRDAAPFLSLGFQLASAVLILYFLGRWADTSWGTSPFLQLTGVLVGCGAGLIKFFRTVQAMNEDPMTKKEKR